MKKATWRAAGLFVGLIGWTLAACEDHKDGAATSNAPSARAPVSVAPNSVASSVPTSKPVPSDSAAPAAGTPPAAQVFASRCAMCHGAAGKGDGKMSAMLTPKPRDCSDPKWQASVTDDQIRTVILGGGAAVGKSAVMPANADLASQPQLVNGLVALIRSWGPASSAPAASTRPSAPPMTKAPDLDTQY